MQKKWKRLKFLSLIGLASYGTLQGYRYTRDTYSEFYWKTIFDKFDKLDIHEVIRHIALKSMLKRKLIPKEDIDENFKISIKELEFRSPIGVGAGFDFECTLT